MEELDRSNKMTIVPNNWMNATEKPADGRHYFGGFFIFLVRVFAVQKGRAFYPLVRTDLKNY